MTVAALGLDLSLSRTGIATIAGHTHSIVPRAGAKDPARRLHEIIEALDPYLRIGEPKIAVLEAYSYGGHQGRTMARLAELGGAVRMRLFELDIPFVEIPPATLKKWATGHGNATKDEMLVAACEKGGSPSNDDEADAFLLRALGVEYWRRVGLRAGSDETERRLLAWLKGGTL